MSSKKIHIDPIDISKIIKFFIKSLSRSSIFIVVLLLFFVCYKFTHKVFSNDYILDTILKTNIYSRQCLYLNENDSRLLSKLDKFYKSLDSKYFVPPIFFQNMPTSFDKERNIEGKKSVYINMLLPILLKIQKESLKERSMLIEISTRMTNEPLLEEDFTFLDNLAKKYKVNLDDDNFWNYVEAVDKLLLKVDIVPISLALAISAKETGWGASRFLKEGNSLFSQWSWSKNSTGMVPLLRSPGKTYVVRKFDTLEDAVRSFYLNINTHIAYSEFRKLRRNMRLTEGTLKSKRLASKLTSYSTEGNYTQILNQIISVNSLEKYDNYNDFSKKYKKICLKVI